MEELKADISDRHPSHKRKILSSKSPKFLISRHHIMMAMGIVVLLVLILTIYFALHYIYKQNNQNTKCQFIESKINKSCIIYDNYIKDDTKEVHRSFGFKKEKELEQQPINKYSSRRSSEEIINDIFSPTVTPFKHLENIVIPLTIKQQFNKIIQNTDNKLKNQHTYNNKIIQVKKNNSLRSVSSINIGLNKYFLDKQMINQDVLKYNKGANNKILNLVSQDTRGFKQSINKHTGNFTLQISGSSNSNALNVWAKKQKLSSYDIYQTNRNNHPWYVLVTGSYLTANEAKRAVSLLPYNIRSQNPWVKKLPN